MTIYEEQVCAEAIDVWGKDAQVVKAIEECAELIQVLAKYKDRTCLSDEEKMKIIDEVVDVEIMLTQVKRMFDLGEQTLSVHKATKISRLDLRLMQNRLKPCGSTHQGP